MFGLKYKSGLKSLNSNIKKQKKPNVKKFFKDD